MVNRIMSEYSNKDILWKNARSKFICEKEHPDIIWNEHDIDEVVARFRETYDEVINTHPEWIPHRSKVDVFVRNFLNAAEFIQDEAERLNWPWEWCTDTSFDGDYFKPNYVILGDSRMYELCSDGPKLKSVQRDKKGKTKNYKSTSRFNGRYRIWNRKNVKNLEEFVCHYFRRRPNLPGKTLEAGHIFGFNPMYSQIVNCNMNNVYWQSSNDNRSIQRLFDVGKYRDVFKKEEKRTGLPIGFEPGIEAMLSNNVKKMPEGMEYGYEFVRGDDGNIKKVYFHPTRGIVPLIDTVDHDARKETLSEVAEKLGVPKDWKA